MNGRTDSFSFENPARGFMSVAPGCPDGLPGECRKAGFEPRRGSMFVVSRPVSLP